MADRVDRTSGGSAEWDLLLTGGSVVTVDDDRRVLEPGAVGIREDRIAFVGTPDLASGRARRSPTSRPSC